MVKLLIFLLAKKSSPFCLHEVFIPNVTQQVFFATLFILLMGNWNKKSLNEHLKKELKITITSSPLKTEPHVS
jgi:hypothetical protein